MQQKHVFTQFSCTVSLGNIVVDSWMLIRNISCLSDIYDYMYMPSDSRLFCIILVINYSAANVIYLTYITPSCSSGHTPGTPLTFGTVCRPLKQLLWLLSLARLDMESSSQVGK